MGDPRTTMLEPYVPRFAREWLATRPELGALELEATLVSVDLSGFTALAERLAARGRAGAEELILLISGVFEGLIRIAELHGGDVLKFRGDALLILFRDEAHAARACVAADRMQLLIDETGRTRASVGPVELSMSTGIHTGPCHFFLVGTSHRELVVAGPAATATVALEDAASAREILVGSGTAAAIDPGWLGEARNGAFLLRRELPDPDAVLAPERPAIAALDPLVPAPLREVLEAERAEAEHRVATVAFVKFGGLDDVIATDGVAEAATRIEALGRLVGEAADALGITWLESDIDRGGGKLYLTAGAPATPGGDEERMLRALRAVVAGECGLTIRAGVNRGNVFAGEIGALSRRTYAVMGDTVNLAARLTARAEPGQILATGDVLDRAASRFESAAQPFLVKGKERAVTAYAVGEVVGVREEQAPERLPLLGRDAELALLREGIDAARLRQSRLVEIVAEPGMGKSRLVEELLASAIGFTHLVTRSEVYATAAPYFVFRPLLRQLAGIVPAASSRDAGEQLTAWVQAVMPDQSPWLPLLAIPFDATVEPTAQTDAIDPAFRRQRLEEVVEQFLSRVLMMPTLLVFEDAHWMDDASRELLLHLTARPELRPWLVCVTRRASGAAFVSGDPPNGTVLELAPLSDTDSSSLAVLAGRDESLSADAVATLVARAGGNPLFVRELVAAARTGALPETVERLMTERIDALSPDDRLLLRHASVVGARFDLELIREILAGELEGVGDVERWRRVGEFVERREDDVLQFRHDLFRAAAYEGLSFRRRREIHARVGAVLERRAGSRTEEAAGLLSLHFLEGDQPEKAWRYSVTAGLRAQARFANVDAVEFYERALRAADELEEPDAPEVARVCEALGDVCELAGRYDESHKAYDRARSLLAGDEVAALRLLRKQGILLERLGRYEDAVEWYRRALEAVAGLELAAEGEAEHVELELELAVVLYRQGRFDECFLVSQGASERAERLDDRRALAHAYRLLDTADLALGGHDETYLERALPIYEELGDLLGKAIVLNNLGMRAYFAGRWDEAAQRYAASREAEHHAGDVVRSATALDNEAEILLEQGHVARAEELFTEARRVYRAASYTFGVGFTTSNLARAAAAAGRFEEAHALFDEATAELESIGAGSYLLEVSARRAECFVLEGRYSEAYELASETLEAAARAGELATRAPLLERLIGYALVQWRRPGDATEHFESSLTAARSGRLEYDLALTLKALDEVGQGSGEPTSREILDRLGVVATPSVPLP